jgi:uncharacterized protein DUF6484
MGAIKDPFEPLVVEQTSDDFDALCRKPIETTPSTAVLTSSAAAIARFHGFDLDDRPVLEGLAELPGELICARTTVSLTTQQVGSEVVVLLERGDVRRPIIIGVLQQRIKPAPVDSPIHGVSIHSDDERYTITAEREIVLRCGDSSITLTRAGKVIIKGNYILSRSTGYNKIKGAAVDIN